MHQLEPSVKTVWAISLLIRTVFYTILIFLAEFFFIKNNIEGWIFPVGSVSGFVLIFGLIISFVYPALMYKYWYFDVRDDEIFTQRGVLTRRKTTAPFSRIQHLEVQQGVFDRMFGLAKFLIYTAGTRGADVMIPGLPVEYAEALRDRLKVITSEDAL